MKTLNLFLKTFIFILLTNILNAQTVNPTSIKDSGFQFSLRAGYDIPDFANDTPYIDYKGGLEVGASIDHYWKWFGVGADFDYINNSPKSTYPTENLFYLGNPVSDFTLTETKIKRTFYGIGPSFKFQKSNKFSAELKLRAGLASIKGGRTHLEGIYATNRPIDLNFHAGYDQSNVFSAKGQLQFNYFFTDFIGVHAGAYYLRHFNVKELVDPNLGVAMGYRAFTTVDTDNMIDPVAVEMRQEPRVNDISSIGVFAGVTFKLPSLKSTKKEECCANYSLAVTARDKYTKEVLPNTDVVLKNIKGEVIQTGTTNTYGVIIFNNIEPENYTINGQLYTTNLDTATTQADEFKPKVTLQKEILYSDLNFIIKGKAVVCNTAQSLNGVSVVLKNKIIAEQKNSITNEMGEFAFNVGQKSVYEIYGKKDNYFSQTETVSTKDYNRNTTLFVKLEVCMEEADCGKAIALKNILYDLDKYFIKDQAKKELNRLVQFMQDNPGVKVELASHTDSRASKEYNKTLSQNRASAAVDYVVSQGIERNRITGVGYGESQLLNNCGDGVDCPEAMHQLNRRTEMKVICPE